VLGIARGGILVAAPVARALHAPLDVSVIRKIGHPAQPELAMGAVSSLGDVTLTEHARDVPPADLAARIEDARERAEALETRLRGDKPPLDVSNTPVIVTDDGVATSATMLCAIESARRRGAARVVCAVPVAPADFLDRLRAACDRLVVLIAATDWLFAVGRYYADFHEVSDEEVRAALREEGETA